MRFLVSQEPTIRRSKKVDFFSVFFRRSLRKRKKLFLFACWESAKEKSDGNKIHITPFSFVRFPITKETAQLSVAQHLDRLTSSVPFSREPNIRKIKAQNFISKPFPPFSRQPNRAIKIPTISSGYDIVTVTVWSLGGAASDVHDIFWQEIRKERHWLHGDGGNKRAGAENSMWDRLL